MILDTLNIDEFNYITTSLLNNKGMSDLEYSILKEKHPYAIMRDDNALILSSMKHYGLHDTQFNSFILNKFGNSNYDIDFFYELIYNVDDYTNPHYDKEISVQTTLILLSDEFTGGELLIDNKDMQLNKKGMYISFDGFKQKHSVNKVLSGQRRVLVIMFNKKQSLF
jgi:hypothetical protein